MPKIHQPAVLLFVLFVGVDLSSNAQNPLWARFSEMNADISYGDRLDIDRAGNVYVTGIVHSMTLAGHLYATDTDDIYLAKFSSQGQVLWVKQFGDSIWLDRAGDVKVDANGDIILFGWFQSPSTHFYGQSLAPGAFIAKIDPDGNLKWVKNDPQIIGFSFPSNGYSSGSRIGIDSKNNIVIYGNGDEQVNLESLGGLYLTKYNPSGAIIWRNTITHDDNYDGPGLGGITIDDNDDIIVTGHFFYWIYFDTTYLENHGPGVNQNGSAQLFVAKFSSDGTRQWAMQSDYSFFSEGYSVTTDKANNIYLTGLVFPGAYLGEFNMNTTSNNTGFIAKLSPVGQVNWVKLFADVSIPQYNFVYPFNIVKDPIGGLYVTGAFYNALSYQNYQIVDNAPEMFVMKVTMTGDVLALSSSHGSISGPDEFSQAYQAVPDSSSNVYVLGTFSDSLVVGTDTLKHSGLSMVTMKLGQFPVYPDVYIYGSSKICASAQVTLTCSNIPGVTHYVWNLPDGITPVTGTSQTTVNSITLRITGNAKSYALSVSAFIQNGSYQSDYFTLAIGQAPMGQFILSGPDSVCSNSKNLRYEASPLQNVDYYEWILPPGIVGSPNDSLKNARAVSLLSEFNGGSISVTAVGACGELASNPVIVAIIPLPAKPIVTGPTLVCNNNRTVFWSVKPIPGALSYEWQFPTFIENPYSFSQTGTVDTLIVLPQFQNGVILVTPFGTCGPGETSDAFQVSAVKIPDIAGDIVGPNELCAGSNAVNYDVSPIANSNKYSWSIPSFFEPNGNVISNSTSIQLVPLAAGSGSIVIRGLNQCNQTGDSSAMKVISVHSLTKPIIEKASCDATLILSQGENIQWFKDGVIMPDRTDAVLALADSGVYYARISNYCGVQESNSIMAHPFNKSEITVPNVITPNGDGKNDSFRLDVSLENPLLLIIDSWGAEVYRSTNYQNNWDGAGLTSGTYYYLIKSSCTDQPYYGWIQVVR